MFEARVKWYEIGLSLRVPLDTLETIEAENRSVDNSFRKVIKYWLQQEDTERTWTVLAKVLKGKMVGRADIGNTLVGQSLNKKGSPNTREQPAPPLKRKKH